MSKYAPLRDHLAGLGRESIRMSFGEIERILGVALPASARAHRAFWSNNGSNNVMTKAWREAGYETAQVDMGGETLEFRRIRPAGAPPAQRPSMREAPVPFAPAGSGPHPLFGLFAGRIVVGDEAALLGPPAPDWEAATLAKHGAGR